MSGNSSNLKAWVSGDATRFDNPAKARDRGIELAGEARRDFIMTVIHGPKHRRHPGECWVVTWKYSRSWGSWEASRAGESADKYARRPAWMRMQRVATSPFTPVNERLKRKA